MHDHDFEIPQIEIEQAFDRLVGALGAPTKMTKAGWTWAVRAATKGWSSFELRAAVKLAARRSRFFPRPRDIEECRPRQDITPPDEQPVLDGCAQCGVAWYYAGYVTAKGDLVPRVRCGCKPALPGFSHPDALAWREERPARTARRAGVTA